MIQRNWGAASSNKKEVRLAVDQTMLMGGLGVLILAYIVFRFIYPLVEKGVLW